MIRQAPAAPYQSVARPASIVRWNTRFADASALHRVLRVGPGEGLARRRCDGRRRGDETAQEPTHLDNFTPTRLTLESQQYGFHPEFQDNLLTTSVLFRIADAFGL